MGSRGIGWRLGLPARRLLERVIGTGLFNRLPVAIFNVAGPWPASGHLAGKLDRLQDAHARVRTVQFLVGFQGQEACGAVPLKIRELPARRANPVSVTRLRVKIDRLEAGRVVLFLHGQLSDRGGILLVAS